MELKVIYVCYPGGNYGREGIHSMELKEARKREEKVSVGWWNPFNGIERGWLVISLYELKVLLRIHSMELKERVVSTGLGGRIAPEESIQWNWKQQT